MNHRSEPAASPWSTPTRVVVALMRAAGAMLVAVAWIGVRSEVDVESQDALATLAVAGFACVVLAVAGWVLAGRARVEVRMRRIVAEQRAPGGLANPRVRIVRPSLRTDPPRDPPDAPVATDAMAHYHRPSCVMAVGKAATPATRAAHRSAGRRACDVCTPDE